MHVFKIIYQLEELQVSSDQSWFYNSYYVHVHIVINL